MLNREHKLTVDDLIVEYMIYKVKNGYDPEFTATEFIDFLKFFEKRIPVDDVIYDGEKLFKRFLERSIESHWHNTIDYHKNETIPTPHMDIEYSEKDKDYIMKANYRLSDFDKSVINTYFMDRGMSKFDDFDGTAKKIRTLIAEYLSDKPKRKLEDSELDEGEIMYGKYIAVEIITQIWESYVDALIGYHKWPEQCKDIDKYLFETDLATIINLPSIKEELINLYKVLSKRIALMYNKDRNLKVSSSHVSYLEGANYDLLIQGCEKWMKATFGPYKKKLDFDLSKLTFSETHSIDSAPVYYLDGDDPEFKTTTSKLGNQKIKTIVEKLEQQNSEQ